MTMTGRKLAAWLPALIIAVAMVIAVSLTAQPAYADKTTYKLYPEKIRTDVLPEKSVTVKVKLVKNPGKTALKNVNFRWVYNKDVLEIKGPKGKDYAKGKEVKFTIKRLKNAESSFTLIAESSDGSLHYENDYYFTTIPTNLKYYHIKLNNTSDGWSYLVNEGGSVSTKNMTVVDGEGSSLPRKAYTLKAEKYLYFDKKKGEEVFEASSFPLKPNPKGTPVNKDGDDLSGVAWFRIYAVATEDGGYKGHTIKDEGFVMVASKYSLNFLVSEVDYGYDNLRICENEEPSVRFEFVKGTKVTPTVKIGKTKLKIGRDYTVRYVDLDTGKQISGFPQKEGTYRCEVKGKGKYYNENSLYCLKIGQKNPVKFSVAKKTVKAKALKKKDITFKPFTVKNKKGRVNYVIKDGDTKALDIKDVNTRNGKVTIAKGTKKGTYKLRVLVTDDATKSPYIFKSQVLTVKVTVK